MPALSRFCPAKDHSCAGGLSGDHRRDQVVHQRIMIRPGTNAGEPAFEPAKFLAAEMLGMFFQQHDAKNFFFQNFAGK